MLAAVERVEGLVDCEEARLAAVARVELRAAGVLAAGTGWSGVLLDDGRRRAPTFPIGAMI